MGLAIAAALKGYRCIFTMPDKMSQEKVRLLKAFGAEVVITPTAVPPDHPENYVMKAKQIVHDTPGAILANQFYNQENPEAHYRTTGPEIWEQTAGRITHFVAGAGTGGTISGAGKFLKERNPGIRVVAGDPVGSLYTGFFRTRNLGEGTPYKVEGIGGDKVPTTIWWDWIDEFRQLTDRDSFAMARRLAREEGILAGGSSGLNVAIALQVAREVDDPNACVVTLLCDTGERYLSKQFSDEWMQENQMLDAPRATVAELMLRRVRRAPALVSVAPSAQVRQALNLMRTWEVSQIPVIDNGECLGTLVDGPLMAQAIAQPSLLDRPVREVMESPLPVVESAMAADRLAPDADPRDSRGAGAGEGSPGGDREPDGFAGGADWSAIVPAASDQRPAVSRRFLRFWRAGSRKLAACEGHCPHRRHLGRARCRDRIRRPVRRRASEPGAYRRRGRHRARLHPPGR